MQQAIINYLEHLTLGSGALIVGLISLAITTSIGQHTSIRRYRWAFNLFSPFLIATGLYWLPTLFGANGNNYATWAALFVLPWYFGGVIGAVLGMLTCEILAKKSNKK